MCFLYEFFFFNKKFVSKKSNEFSVISIYNKVMEHMKLPFYNTVHLKRNLYMAGNSKFKLIHFKIWNSIFKFVAVYVVDLLS